MPYLLPLLLPSLPWLSYALLHSKEQLIIVLEKIKILWSLHIFCIMFCTTFWTSAHLIFVTCERAFFHSSLQNLAWLTHPPTSYSCYLWTGQALSSPRWLSMTCVLTSFSEMSVAAEMLVSSLSILIFALLLIALNSASISFLRSSFTCMTQLHIIAMTWTLQ